MIGSYEEIITLIKKEVFELCGLRVKDGVCAYCGKILNVSEFCSCSKARQTKRYFQKSSALIEDLMNRGLLEDFNSHKEKILKNLITPPIFDGLVFDDYIVEAGNKSQENAKAVVEDYFKNGIKNLLSGMNLILLGNYGTGKTMLMSILCNALREEYLANCCFINSVNLMEKIKQTFHASSQKHTSELIDNFRKIPFLFLDDIDKIKPTDYVRELFYGLMNYRIENELPLIISANHSLEELDDEYFGEAIVSRIVAKSKIVKFTHANKRFGG